MTEAADAPIPAPIPAATVVLVRPGAGGPEVLLTRRPPSMAFAPDVYVFPGGRVDPGDADASLARRSAVTPAEAARSMGGDLAPHDALAAYVAAIRELFEEAGVLLADLAEPGDLTGAMPGAASGRAIVASVSRSSLGAARSALVGGDASLATIAAELGLRLRTDLLVPLSRWVTPPTLPRRFDARFFAAELPAGARVTFEGDEVVDHAWLAPGAALRAMAAGEIAMWVPTSATLQQLEHAPSVADMRRISPGRLGEIEVEDIDPAIVRIVMPAGGGVAGQPVCAHLVGRRRHILIDPGDPTGPALERAIAVAERRGGTIVAVALTHADPDHAGGSEALAEMLRVPILAGPGAGDVLPYDVEPLADGQVLDACDTPITAVHAPGPRSDHVAFIVGPADGARFVISGDLDGRRGQRTIPAPVDQAALMRSRERLRGLAPDAPWLAGHPDAPGAAGWSDVVGVDARGVDPEAPRHG